MSQSESFFNDLVGFQANLEARLKIYFEEQIINKGKINNQIKEALEIIRDLTLASGKRLRPYLLKLGIEIAKEEKQDWQKNQEIELSEDFWSLAIGLEVFHSFALIHDDIIDQADTRRGLDAAHINYQKRFSKKTKKSVHYGISAGILAGDLAHFLADELFWQNLQGRVKILDLYSLMQAEVLAGQMDDTFGLGLENLDNLQEEKILSMLDYKSGRYSIQKPLLLGASLENLEAEKIETLSIIGQKLGLIFQLTDDLVSLFSQTSTSGKDNLTDLREGKRTLLIALAIKAATQREKELIFSILGKADLKPVEAQPFLDFLLSKEIDKQVFELSLKYFQEVFAKVEAEFPESKTVRKLLFLGEYLLSRKD